jgi:ATP-dependent DNA helicase RecG
MELNDDIIKINNIGEQRANKLHQLGIYTVGDIVEYFPRDYNDRSTILNISNLEIDKENTFIAEVASQPENLRINNRIITKLKLKDATATIVALWYNQAYLKNYFFAGQNYLFTGKVVKKSSRLEVAAPEYEKLDDKELLSGGRIVPVYASTYKLSQKMLRQLIKSVLEDTYNQLQEFLPLEIRKKCELCDRNFAIQNIHFPIDEESFFIARYRLVFEELFLLQLGLLRIKALSTKGKTGLIIESAQTKEEFVRALPFKLTNAQLRTIDEIEKDFKSGNVMNRLVQGDVGSGKTIVAIVSAYTAVKAGYQVAMMVPTEILAKQHYESFSSLLGSSDINTVLLTGSMTKKQKQVQLEKIENGDANIVIGTHALIQDNVLFNRLGFVITDEQHRFGVGQRSKLADKGVSPHTLVMTATPIPRTLALILYGDLDISIIDELPPGRQKVETFSVAGSYHERIYAFINKEIDMGRQVYIVCPMVEETDKDELKSVMEYTNQLKQEVFKGHNVEYIHGKMKANQKQQIMDQFIAGNINILVATTVIEVGINVANASLMVIENAERFGLAQLHQLRGRVGRGNYKSYCILITDSKSKMTQERMKIMQKTNDGFELSEVDLDLRGPGDFFGTRQHGLPEMKIANLYKDIDILKQAQQQAENVIKEDCNLEKAENLALKYKLENFFDFEKIKVSL